MNALFSSRAADAVLFAAVTVFTVVSLELYRVWLDRGASVARARITGAALALIFLCLMGGGVAEFVAVGRADFLGLGFFLNGAAGLGILPGLFFQQGRERESRRIAAHDL